MTVASFWSPFLGSSFMLLNFLLVVIAYLLGSVSTAIVTCRVMGLPDPRTQGSGNPGATNVLRHGGRRAALITLTGDMLKGLLPVLVARVLGVPIEVVALVGLAAFLGHLFPVFFGFRGGKGVATLIGILFGVGWSLGLAYVLTWLLVAAIWRISSLAALVAAALVPFFSLCLLGNPLVAAVIATASLLLIVRHRFNIEKLIEGREDHIGGRR
jgi:glycerol-3-phosphate acyltransferase PlsY